MGNDASCPTIMSLPIKTAISTAGQMWVMPLYSRVRLMAGLARVNADRIATLKRWIPFNSAGNNLVDAGIGEIITGTDVSNEIGCDIGLPSGVRELTAGDIDTLEVQKCGRTTCHTTGTVTDIDVTVDVGYELLTPTGIVPRSYQFIHQIFTTYMSTSGDSGSLIMDMDNKAVGLLFAGSSTVTVATPIQTVFDELNIELQGLLYICIPGAHSSQYMCDRRPEFITPLPAIGAPCCYVYARRA